MTVVESLTALPERVKSGEAALQLDGVGYKISRKIQEILDTGKLKELDDEKVNPRTIAINDLCRVYGIGPAKARKLIGMGYNSVEDLKKKKPPLNLRQKIGLKYLDEFEKSIPRKEVKSHLLFVQKAISNLDPKFKVECLGSYRRDLKECTELDFMVSHPNYHTLDSNYALNSMNSIKKCLSNYLTEEFSFGEHQLIGVARLEPWAKHRKFVLKLYPTESYYTGLLQFTGSSEFIRQLRRVAKIKGYKLTEYSLAERHPTERKGGKNYLVGPKIPLKSESDIFQILGVPYRTPNQRSIG